MGRRLKEFRAAYAVQPNWKLLNNIGLCALNLERDGEAIEAYKEYLSHGGEKDFTNKQRKQMEKDIATLTASLVNVTVTVEPSEASLLDERKNSKGEILANRYRITNGKALLGLHPGHHKITIESPGYLAAAWTIDADPSSTHSHVFTLEPEKKREAAFEPQPESEPPKETVAPKPVEHHTPTSVYVGLALTGVFAAAATTTGVIALSNDKSFNNATDPAEESRLKSSGKTFVLLTDIGIGAAILSAGATAYFYFTAPSEKPAPTEKSASLRLTPTAGLNAAGLAFTGKF